MCCNSSWFKKEKKQNTFRKHEMWLSKSLGWNCNTDNIKCCAVPHLEPGASHQFILHRVSKTTLCGLFSLRATETHALAAANQQKNDRLRAAFGISSDYVDGSSFQADRKEKEKEKREQERLEKERLQQQKYMWVWWAQSIPTVLKVVSY